MWKEYRTYQLDIIPNTEEIIFYLENLYERSEETELDYPYMSMAEYTELHWPRHEDIMKEISLRFPGVSFELYSWGRQFGDVWKKVFKNGTFEMFEGFIEYKSIRRNVGAKRQ
jgi:hypothetical protein